jgi:NADH dehydrogenase
VVSIRRFTRRASFRLGTVEAVDPEGQFVKYRVPGDKTARKVTYDHLVVSLGSVTRLPDVPGLRRYGFQLKTLGDAVALRDRAVRHLEIADASGDVDHRKALLHFVIVGGNFTGVELAGELLSFLRRASLQYRNVSAEECRVTLVEISDRILGSLGPDLGGYALRQLRKRGVDVRLEKTVKTVESERAKLSESDWLRSSTVIWCAGIQPSPALAGLPFKKDERGYLCCERDLRLAGHENVWGIGDCAVNIDAEGNAYPATAQHATRAGRHLARNIERALRGMPSRDFDYRGLGMLAGLGCRTAVAKVMGIKLSGFPAWFLWRTVYLLKMPGWARKLRVASDWTLDLLFGKEPVGLGLTGGPESPLAGAPLENDPSSPAGVE